MKPEADKGPAPARDVDLWQFGIAWVRVKRMQGCCMK